MPSETHCGLKKSASLRSVLSDPSSIPDTPASPGIKSPNRLPFFWKRRRMVIPAAIPLSEQSTSTAINAPALPSPFENDSNDNIIFLNNPTEFDLRSIFFRRPKPNSLPGSLDRSVASYGSSTSSCRSHAHEFTSIDTMNKDTPSQAKADAVSSTTDGSVASQRKRKPRRRLRAKEELCLVLPRSSSNRRTSSQKSWFLGPGLIGCEPGEGTIVVTKDPSMDAVHAEVSVAGDDYLVRDAQSTTGTFLCLSTCSRHYPQRDGFRLRHGDVFRIGPSTSIRVLELGTTTATTTISCVRNDELSLTKTDRPKTIVEFIANASPCVLKRPSTEEEFRLIASDIEDECRGIVNDADTRCLDAVARNEENETSPAGVHRSVQFVDTPPVMSDGSVFLGSRYLRQESKNRDFNEPSEVEDEDDDVVKHLIGREPQLPEQCARACAPQSCRPASVRLLIFQHDPAKAADPLKPHKAREVMLSGQNTYLIGSSPTCDVRVFPSEGIEVQAVHSRITFDGTSFVLQDLSFERNLRRQTRVLLNQRAVRVVRGDWLLLGACALQVTTVTKAFGWDRRSDMKEAAIRLDVLRLSKRKPRTRGIFLPVGFRLISTSGSGASSGSNGWGGSSGGPVMFGKGRDCAAQIFTASLAIEQFSVQLERGTCLLTPKATGINAGTYFLIGRDDPGLPSVNDRSGDTLNTERTQKAEAADVVKCTSKPLLLSENCVFRCGGCELEVIYVKSTAIPTDGKSKAAIEEQEHIQLLSNIPWLQPITHDRKLIVSLVRCGQRQRLVAGDVIYEIGDSANFLFIVIAGEVRLLSLSNSDDTDDMQALTERVTAGGFFGEVSLQSPSGLYNLAPSSGGLEYTENATATTVCEILAFAKEDFCGYLEIYMDVVRAHLRFVQAQDKLIRVASNDVPWLRGISLQEKRMVAENAEIARYVHGSVLFDDGKLFVPTASFHDSTPQLRGGLLVLTRGKVCIIRNKNGRQRQFKPLENETSEEEQQHLKGVPDVEEEEEDLDEWWNPNDPVIVVGSSSSPTMSNICDLSVRLEAYSTVECLFIAEAHIAHLVPGVSKQELSNDHPAVVQYSTPLASGNSLVTQRSHHSQVVTSGSGDDDSDGSDDDDHHPLGNSDGKGGRRRWRRKKRNKQLLEQTVLETQNDAQIPNALVLYMLAGAHRGDIHVVRNVATIGGWLSGAGIELNDRYVSRSHAIIEYHDNKYWLYDSGSKWGTFVRLEEEKVVDVHPGNVFLAGEVEFTCLGSFPERNKSSICCIM